MSLSYPHASAEDLQATRRFVSVKAVQNIRSQKLALRDISHSRNRRRGHHWQQSSSRSFKNRQSGDMPRSPPTDPRGSDELKDDERLQELNEDHALTLESSDVEAPELPRIGDESFHPFSNELRVLDVLRRCDTDRPLKPRAIVSRGRS
ncbi:hypothetical protein M378DRAFT_17462 [Amanita muscaria Koide BX008]|uniref:Uncharacterized protein n=1 Tax=Amanita muscaria (strain Koide BX008) TaxID=946122 RepID=A0A0C2WHA7_AMAMK|nr:hypothetical protein M378DRAFT_17462 [Amanita muscaria Koide BX008]